MDAYAKQVFNYLQLMQHSALLVSERDKANIDILLTMLGETDKHIICAYFGLFGQKRQSLEAIALEYKVEPAAIMEILSKDLRKVAITPEWQMMKEGFKTAVKEKIGIK